MYKKPKLALPVLNQFLCIVAILPLIMLAGLIGGCSTIEGVNKSKEKKLADVVEASDESGNKVDSMGRRVRFDGGGLLMGEADALAFTPATFLQTVENQLSKDTPATIARLVRDFPDVAVETLQSPDWTVQNKKGLLAIATELDSFLECPGFWSGFISELYQRNSSAVAHLESKKRAWEELKNNRPQKVLKPGLSQNNGRSVHPMIKADSYRIEAIAAIMDDQYAVSMSTMGKAISLVEQDCPYYASKLQLLSGEFLRHADRLDDWKSTWSNAVILQSELLSISGIHDPTFWENASSMRPAGLDWPQQAIDNLKQFLATNELPFPSDYSASLSECVVWETIGILHLGRNEGQNSVLAFKKAEANLNNSDLRDEIQLLQARAMLAAGQPGAASAILIRTATTFGKEPKGQRAKAILGSMKLQNGSAIQGLSLLESALEDTSNWPAIERMQAKADLGLAQLMNGRETLGIETLEQVQQEFIDAGQFEQARMCLLNLAAYYEKTRQGGRQQAAVSKLTEIDKASW